jgi:hypothetical protein
VVDQGVGANALAASVLSSDVPTDPPTCWVVLTMAEAIPASLVSRRWPRSRSES